MRLRIGKQYVLNYYPPNFEVMNLTSIYSIRTINNMIKGKNALSFSFIG